MTSTVLDVTVLLLCVSASVITLGAAGGGSVVDDTGYTADDAADRLATETVTVTYPVSEGKTESRAVHATLVELLSMAVAAERWSDTATADRFQTRTIAAVDDALGPRTRVDVRHRVGNADAHSGNTDSRRVPARSGTRVGVVRGGPGGDSTTGSARDYRPIAVGPEPPSDAPVTVAVVTQSGPERSAGDEGRTDRLRVVVRAW